jgi:hypothetical protein
MIATEVKIKAGKKATDPVAIWIEACLEHGENLQDVVDAAKECLAVIGHDVPVDVHVQRLG